MSDTSLSPTAPANEISNDDLRQQLLQAQRTIARLEKHKADFISVASHELKTPLPLIEGYANMLKTDFPAEEYPRAGAMLRGILNGTQRLREIIEDMIDVSLLEMNLLDLNLQPVWLGRLLKIVMEDVRKASAERQLTFLMKEESFYPEALQGDPERLFQAFSKLVENAVKYTPDGGKITLEGRQDADHAYVVVRDTGIGLNQEDFEAIFEKFFSLGQIGLHSSSKYRFKGGGPGLGLAIAKGIIEAHQGKIWVESEGFDERLLKGSQFHVSFPLPKTVSSNPAS